MVAVPLDFSEKWPPVVVKELRQALRQPFFVWPFVIVQLLAALAVSWEWMALQQKQSGDWIFSESFWIVAHLVVVVIMPLRCFDSLAEERERAKNELLILSGVTRWQVVRGKCLVQSILTLLTLCSLLPYLLVRFFFGGFDFWLNLGFLLELALSSLAFSGVVIGGSGFATLAGRIGFILLGLIYTTVVAASSIASAAVLASGFWGAGAVSIVGLLTSYLGSIFLATLGLQVGRGHLKLCIRPWEVENTHGMTIFFVFSPLILLIGSMATLGFGTPVVVLLMTLAAVMYDRQVLPAVAREK
jgi:ABC-type transport system involved in multi-copper enzyme maturation permease subunit